MDAPAYELETGRQQQKQGKVSIFSFIFHEHSFLGLFVPDNHVSPPIQPCCCCCVFTDDLTRRHRLFTFVVVFTLMMATTVELHVTDHEAYGLGEMFLQIAIITPVTCFLKTHLPPTSAWFQAQGVGPWGKEGKVTVRAEEILLILVIVYSIVTMVQHTAECAHCADQVDDCQCTKAVSAAFETWFTALVVEAATLPLLYYCGKKCCCGLCGCCVPKTYEFETAAGTPGAVAGEGPAGVTVRRVNTGIQQTATGFTKAVM